MWTPKFIRKMHSATKRSLLCGCLLVLVVIALAIGGVLGKSVPESKVFHGAGEEQWYVGKDLKLVHLVS